MGLVPAAGVVVLKMLDTPRRSRYAQHEALRGEVESVGDGYVGIEVKVGDIVLVKSSTSWSYAEGGHFMAMSGDILSVLVKQGHLTDHRFPWTPAVQEVDGE